MGGGTLLIPLLTVFCDVPQHIAQAVNLVSFVPMAGVALIIHFKKKLVDKSGVLYIIIPSCIAAVGAAFLAKGLDAGLLKKLFGGFIIILGIYQIVCEIIAAVKKKKQAAFDKETGKEKPDAGPAGKNAGGQGQSGI